MKIGYSERHPKVRAAELDGTSSPHPHVVRYAALVLDPRKVESVVHRQLASQREGKEWFEISVEEAVDAIRSHAGEILFEEDSGDISQEQLRQIELKKVEAEKRRKEQAGLINQQEIARQTEEARLRRERELEQEKKRAEADRYRLEHGDCLLYTSPSPRD